MPKGDRQFSELKFCPRCGVDNIDRDRYRIEIRVGALKGKDFYPEFLCNVCGFGFLVKPSLRWEHAKAMFKAERKLRPPADRHDGKGV